MRPTARAEPLLVAGIEAGEDLPMLKCFFDVHSSEGVDKDQIGTLFADAASARADAMIVVAQMARLRVEKKQGPVEVTIVIRDDEDLVIDTVLLPA